MLTLLTLHVISSNAAQVDFRLLRAVAIEHPTDADAAVLDVLTELPSLNTQSLSLVSPAQVLHRTGSPVTGNL